MSIRVLMGEVRGLINDALERLNYPNVDYNVAETKEEYGDLASNIAFQLSKLIKKSPSIIAENIKSKIEAKGLIGSVSVLNGYINFKADIPSLASITLNNIFAKRERYGSLDIGKGRKVLIEHTSVNPNKALHIGHVRNLVLGDCIYRLLRFTGYDAYVLNYIDDSGLQVADIIVGFKFLNMPLNSSKKFDHYCGDDVYVKVNDMYEHDSSLLEKRRLVLKAMEDYNSDLARFAREITIRVLNEQLKTCWRLNARYDCLNFESQIVASKLWDRVLEMIKEKGIVEYVKDTSSKYNGCIVVKAGIEGEEKVLVRSDGTTTYIAKDIPYAMWKLGAVDSPFKYIKYAVQYDGTVLYATSLDDGCGDVNFSNAYQAITIVDVRQSRLQNIIAKILSMLGYDSKRYVHLTYEVVALSANTARMLNIDIGNRRFMHMKGREGIYINADIVLDMLHNKAYEEVKARNRDADEQWIHDVAEKIAVSAIRYIMIKHDLDKIITFDINDALNLQGDTAPYIQYSYARAYRILEKAGISDYTQASNTDLLNKPEEIALIKAMARFDLVIEDLLNSLSPKVLAKYCYSLASIFNEFYEHIPILHEEDKALREVRLQLTNAYTIVLSNCMNLLGISVLKSM